MFRNKQNADGTIELSKARLVANGFSQKPGIDFSENPSPVFWWDIIRTVLSLDASQKLKLSQFDVKIAFFYEIFHEDIYMIQLEGFDNGTK